MTDDAGRKLKEFEIPLLNHTRYFGVFLASHAIRDSIIVLHMGTGCKMKGGLHLPDYARESFSQVCWTEVSGNDITANTHAMIEDTVLTSYDRRKPGMIALCISSVIEMTGFDVADVVESIRYKLPCPLIHIPTPGYDGDMYNGFSDFTMELLRFVEWDKPPQENTVNIVGYPFDRYEMDQVANVNELRRLLHGLGMQMESCFYSGQNAKQLLNAHAGGLNVALPYLGASRERLPEITKRPSANVGLPVGIAGTAHWLHQVAASAGVDGDRAQAFIDAEIKKTRPMMDIARRFLPGNKIIIIQPTPLAAAFTSLALELDMVVKNVVLLDQSLGGREAFLNALGPIAGRAAAADICIHENPSWRDITNLPELIENETREDALVLSPAIEMGLVQMQKLYIVETGFPSYNKHFIYPLPTLGFNGTVALTQRFLDAFIRRH